MAQKRLPAWVPYVSEIEVKSGKLRMTYKGGTMQCERGDLATLMIYGDSVDLPLDALEWLARDRVPVIIHRRNVTMPVVVNGGLRGEKRDILTAQLQHREDGRRRKYIARVLLNAKFEAQRWLVPPPSVRLIQRFSLDQLRNIEAHHGQRYWSAYFEAIGMPREHRRAQNPVSAALDAASRFLHGIVLRWISYHHLSPYHGFLHQPTDYPGLVYDCMEPYRSDIDRAVFGAYRQNGEDGLIERSIATLKAQMHERVYCAQTRQVVARQELYHGIVLAMRAYLLGEMRRLVVPSAGGRRCGRPIKVSWKLYGRVAGFSDFTREGFRAADTPIVLSPSGA